MTFQPTSYPDVNEVLGRLLIGAQRVLGDQFLGLYLYGSLSSGDFNPHSSDIDFVVITAGELPAETVSALESMHADLAASGLDWAAKLEGCYLPQRDLPRHNPSMAPCPHINEGRFYLAKHGSDWAIQRHILREYGVVIAGPPIAPLIDPVSADDLREAVRGTLIEWWKPLLLRNPARLHGSDYQAFAVLTMCRALYTLETGQIASKPICARWAQAALDPAWSSLIAEAAAWGHGDTMDRFDEMAAFVRLTLDRYAIP